MKLVHKKYMKISKWYYLSVSRSLNQVRTCVSYSKVYEMATDDKRFSQRNFCLRLAEGDHFLLLLESVMVSTFKYKSSS